MSTLTEKLKEEMRALVPPAIYFLVALHLVAFVRVLMLEGTGISAKTSISVTRAALILAKAVLIADLLPVINRFPDKPLVEMIWPHFWAIEIFLFVLILMYCATRELVRVIGKEQMRAIFFGPPRSVQP